LHVGPLCALANLLTIHEDPAVVSSLLERFMNQYALASSWLQYQTEQALVMVSPAITHRSAAHWPPHAISALTRPELGLLPQGVRYVLALDDSLRLECAATNPSRPAPGQPGAHIPADDLLAVYEAERRVWTDATQAEMTEQLLRHGGEASDIEDDEEEPASPEHWEAL